MTPFRSLVFDEDVMNWQLIYSIRLNRRLVLRLVLRLVVFRFHERWRSSVSCFCSQLLSIRWGFCLIENKNGWI